MKPLAVACALAGVLCAQQFKINLDHLEAKASSKVDLAFDSTWLRFGGTFMDSKDPDEAKAKKIISGLEGLYVKHFEFKTEGQYTQGDVDQIRLRLQVHTGLELDDQGAFRILGPEARQSRRLRLEQPGRPPTAR